MSKIAWKDVNWTLVQKRNSRQQRRVYKASKDGNKKVVHALQRRIIGSLDAKLLAVQRVTTESQGRNIFSMDSLKALSNDKKIELAYKLKLDGKTKVSRRVDISKIKAKKVGIRSLDITTIEDRAKQMLVKFALEPEWEAIFEPNSYGCVGSGGNRSGCRDGQSAREPVLPHALCRGIGWAYRCDRIGVSL